MHSVQVGKLFTKELKFTTFLLLAFGKEPFVLLTKGMTLWEIHHEDDFIFKVDHFNTNDCSGLERLSGSDEDCFIVLSFYEFLVDDTEN